MDIYSRPPSVPAVLSNSAHVDLLETIPQAPLLLTIRDAQQLLQLGRNTVYELCNTPAPEGIRCITVGKSKRIPRAELERWIERLSVSTGTR